MAKSDKPNILVIWGDDIGQSNLSCYTHGLMGYHTPNIDRIAKEGMLFSDSYGEQSCTAGRSSFITGQSVLRTGLSKVGVPAAPIGMSEKIITIDQIQRRVCDFFGLKMSDLKAKNRTRAIAFPRQVAMYLSRQMTHSSLSEIGRAFGGKDHTTVLHAVDKIQTLLQDDPKLRKTIDGLVQSVNL